MDIREYNKLRDETAKKVELSYGEAIYKACYCGHTTTCDCLNPIDLEGHKYEDLIGNIPSLKIR